MSTIDRPRERVTGERHEQTGRIKCPRCGRHQGRLLAGSGEWYCSRCNVEVVATVDPAPCNDSAAVGASLTSISARLDELLALLRPAPSP